MLFGRFSALIVLAATALLPACATSTPAPAVAQSILQSSSPANGAAVKGPVDQLKLRFSPAARLREVTVTASDGTMMPMMVTAVGEVADYSLPVDGLGVGNYTVNWRATVGAQSHQGSFSFTVR